MMGYRSLTELGITYGRVTQQAAILRQYYILLILRCALHILSPLNLGLNLELIEGNLFGFLLFIGIHKMF